VASSNKNIWLASQLNLNIFRARIYYRQKLMLLFVGIGMLMLGLLFISTATLGAGSYGPPSDLVLGLGILVTAMGLILSIIAASVKTENASQERELRE
jgi:hypothetical protein